MTERDKLRIRIRRRLVKVIKECRQTIIDGEWWAENRPEEAPIDFEWFRVTLAKAERCLEALDRGDEKLPTIDTETSK